MRRAIQDSLLAAVLLSTLGACARFEPKPISASGGASALQSRELSSGELRRFLETNLHRRISPWPARSWDLPMLTQAGFYFQPDLAVARAKLAGTEAAIITAGARPNPTASFSPTFAADSAAGISPWTLGFSLDVPIETAGKRGYRIAQAQHLANAARLNVTTAAWQVRSRARKGLLDAFAAQQTAQILSNQQAAQNQNLELLEERFKAGDISSPQVSLARVSAQQATLLLRDAEKLGGEARARLANAIGVPASSLAGVDLSFGAFARPTGPVNAGALRREALLNRADVLAALAEYDASQSALQLEIAKQYPDVHLGPGYAFDQGEDKFTLGLSVTLPVLNQNQGPIAEAKAHRSEAAARFMAVQNRVIGEVDQAFASYRGAGRKLETADALLAAQRKRQQSVEASFKIGASDRLELLQSQLELSSAELSRANALVEMQQAVGLLEDAMQRPLESPGKSPTPARLINRKSR